MCWGRGSSNSCCVVVMPCARMLGQRKSKERILSKLMSGATIAEVCIVRRFKGSHIDWRWEHLEDILDQLLIAAPVLHKYWNARAFTVDSREPSNDAEVVGSLFRSPEALGHFYATAQVLGASWDRITRNGRPEGGRRWMVNIGRSYLMHRIGGQMVKTDRLQLKKRAQPPGVTASGAHLKFSPPRRLQCRC